MLCLVYETRLDVGINDTDRAHAHQHNLVADAAPLHQTDVFLMVAFLCEYCFKIGNLQLHLSYWKWNRPL